METKLQGKVLSSSEERNIDQQIESLKNVRDESEIIQGLNFEAKNIEVIEEKIKELEKIKQAHSIPKLSNVQRAKVDAELEMLTADLQKDMPTWTQYSRSTPKDGPQHTALVQKIYRWEHDPVRRQKIQRWRTLRRLREPENPMAANTTFLFPQ